MTTTHGTGRAPFLPERGDIWFEDGNVVLQAQSTQFRVHRGVLSANSAIFADLFTIPQPASEELVDGCPVVQLSDSAEDLCHILEAIYNRKYEMTFIRS